MYVLLIVVCPFLLWPLCCLFFFDLWNLISPLVSSNSSKQKYIYNNKIIILIALILSFLGMFCRSLFVLCHFFFWPLCCVFFFDLRIMITPLVSSNSSYSNHVFFKLSNCIKYVCGYAYRIIEVMIMVFNATFSNISVISWQ